MCHIDDRKAICTAPSGKVRLVHTDARDHWPTVEGDYPDLSALRQAVSRAWAPRAAEYSAYDDQGHPLSLN